MCTLVKCLLVAAVAVTVSSHSLGPQDVVFHLFTRANPSQSQVLFPTESSILVSNFAPNKRTIFTIHGLQDFDNSNAFMVPAHMEAEDVNVIAVDWRAGSNTYSEGVSQANQVGLIISGFINLLNNQFSYPPSQIRIVGVGLGGHIAAIAGRLVVGNIPHIVAIDPSLHGWSHHPGRLGTDAATIVEVLHTTAGIQGYDLPLGHIDFYPNGGSQQIGCGMDVSCSHVYGVAFYAESIVAPNRGTPNFVGTACDSHQQAMTMRCTGANNVNFGGAAVKTSGSGIFVFATNAVSPFARG
ncbi:unnamed protein product [Chilo suppressalis]|uniref:Lipase domain-containing protein n=1 Tax=Chilo suppressalis TaxID=168631 RepID=A0ABN8B7K4_CHISP|nr:hypothetical protein evm_000930 [Chilo suppressalis]CAH0405502.1 unnamed protein product [Chilo suppressalis]